MLYLNSTGSSFSIVSDAIFFLMADQEANTFSTEHGERVYFGIKDRISRKPGGQIGQQQGSTINFWVVLYRNILLSQFCFSSLNCSVIE